jgi:hypothetical protein
MPKQNGKLEEIRAVLTALQRFAAEQSDPAARFHAACLEVRLAMALERDFDAQNRKKLAETVDRLAASLGPSKSRRVS